MATATRPRPGGATHRAVLEDLALALVPGLLLAYFAFAKGGYFPNSTGLVAAVLALLLGARLAFARLPWQGVSPALVIAAVALAGFAAWTNGSSDWSHAAGRALVEYQRVLLYLLIFLLFGTLAFSVRRVRWMLYGLAAGAVVVCGTAFIARTLPDVLYRPSDVHPERLSYPLDYWNSLGLLSALGIIFCGHLACGTSGSRIARVLGAAAVPMLAATLYFTFSRGATWVALVAVVLYVVIGRPRGAISAAVATVPASAVALMAANPLGALTGPDPTGAAAVATGHRIALTVGACMAGAAIVRALLLPLDAWTERVRLPDRWRRPLLVGGVAGVATAAVAVGLALGVPSLVGSKWDQFVSPDAKVQGSGSTRLFNAGTNGRRALWDVALDSFAADRLHGSGAGTYELTWTRDRPTTLMANDGHSIYLEVLGELGAPGLILLGSALLMLVGGLLFRARGPDRPLFAALLAAALAWGLHAAVDWDWEMPAVTLWLFACGGAALATRRDSRPMRRAVVIPLRVACIAAGVALAVLPARIAISENRLSDAADLAVRGACGAAKERARSALDAFGAGAGGYHLIGYCDMEEGRYRDAVRQMRLAVAHDPGNWEMHQSLAVAQAGAGLDPRREARESSRLNPREKVTSFTVQSFSSLNRAHWMAYARTIPVATPWAGDGRITSRGCGVSPARAVVCAPAQR